MDPRVRARISELCEQHDLPAGADGRLVALLSLLASDPLAPTTVTDPAVAVDVHLADSLVALSLHSVRSAQTIVDIGSGAGFPGLPLAIALPGALVSLVESNGRKCDFLRRAVAGAGLTNARVVQARAEQIPDSVGRYDVATARALAPLSVVAEYAAPLLEPGGTLVAWKGHREAEEEEAAARAAGELGLEFGEIASVQPFREAEARHLYVISKVRPTPDRFPRRAGVARKRPLGASSDRERR
jgi:16S rRNA (guanine527-N7)-methyltransferase